MKERQIVTLKVGEDESIAYGLDVSAWGSGPTGVEVKAYDITDNARTDVSLSVLSGSPSVAGDIITLPKIENLSDGHTYRVEIKFSLSGNTFEPFMVVIGEK